MSERRLLFIGGATAAGKTTTARELSLELGAGWLEVDAIWLVLRALFPAGSPERQILAFDEVERLLSETPERLANDHRAAAVFVCEALPPAIGLMLETHSTLVVEGAWLLPSFMAAFEFPNTRIDRVVIHEAEAREVILAMKHRHGVTATLPFQRAGAPAWWRYGNQFAEEALGLGIRVVAARPRETLPERVRAAALGV